MRISNSEVIKNKKEILIKNDELFTQLYTQNTKDY
jgi:hypothetical protein